MNRVAQVKSQRNAGEFLNGTVNFSEFVITTPKVKENGQQDMTDTYEVIKPNSIGYAKELQLLTSFDIDETTRCFVFCKKVDRKTME